MSFDFVKMGQRLEQLEDWSDRLGKWPDDEPLPFTADPIIEIINEMRILYDENCRLRRELASMSEQKKPTRPVSCQQLLSIVKELRPEDDLFCIDFQDEMISYMCDYCGFESHGVDNPQILHDPDCPVYRIREFLAAIERKSAD